MTDIINIPLSKLAPWKGNVRKTQNKGFIAELAASIKAHGLQQNLIVFKDGQKYAVIAGGQRLKALQQLAKEEVIEAGYPVPCKVTAAAADGTELSLAENVVRDNMHPADQFEAFCKLVDKGATVTDVAARFGITETLVQQRLKLARVSPVILKAYRKEELNLEQVMAFTITDDHEAQEHVFSHFRNSRHADPRGIRDALTENDIAATDKRVTYVTLAAYEKAGGALKRDLFTDDKHGIFILDTALLDRLVTEKLERAATVIRKEGWKWVEIIPEFSYEEKSKFQRRYAELEPLPPKQQAKLDQLQQEYDSLCDQWSDSSEDEEQPARLAELEEIIGNLNDRDEIWIPETLAIAGAVVSIGYNGRTDVDRGLVRPEDAPKRTAKGKSSGPEEDGKPQPTTFSAALIESLTLHKSAALSAELISRPDIALAAVVHALASKILLGSPAIDTSLQINALQQPFRNLKDSLALNYIQSERQTWGSVIPGTSEALWTWCLDQDQTRLLDLLAFCTATTVNAVQCKPDRPDAQRLENSKALAEAVHLDMLKWFFPAADNYFSRISKPQILEALREARGTAPAPAWEKLKKPELAILAEQEVAGKNWLPEPLRRS